MLGIPESATILNSGNSLIPGQKCLEITSIYCVLGIDPETLFFFTTDSEDSKNSVESAEFFRNQVARRVSGTFKSHPC